MTNKTVVIGAAIVITIATIFILNQPALVSSPDENIKDNPSTIETNQQYSYNDILNNDEFKLSMQNAVKNSDMALAESLQVKALEIAQAANLPANEMKLISGENGLRFMQFLASRQLFVDEFQHHYLEFKDIEQLKIDYPEAQDLFAQSDKLIETRNVQIQQLAQELAGERGDIELYIEIAKEQWILRQQDIETE